MKDLDSFSIERQINDKWHTICDGIDSGFHASNVAEMLSTHQKHGGRYRVIYHFTFPKGYTEVNCIWNHGEQFN